MIKSGDIIKHNAFLDVAVQVFFVSEHPETKDIIINGVWINQGQTKTFSINEPVRFRIKQKHLCNWSVCENPRSSFIRKEKWKQLND